MTSLSSETGQPIAELAVAQHRDLLEGTISNGHTEHESLLVVFAFYDPSVPLLFSSLLEHEVGSNTPPSAYRRLAYSEIAMLARIGGPNYPAYSRRQDLLNADDPRNWRGGAFTEPIIVAVMGCSPQRNFYLASTVGSYAAMLCIDDVTGGIQT